MLIIDPAFQQTDAWRKLSPGAQAALQGLLQFAIQKHGRWTVEGSAAQIGNWVGPESGLGRKPIQDGLAELELAGLLHRGRSGTQPSAYTISVPLIGS